MFQGLEEWLDQFQTIDAKTLLAVGCNKAGLTVNKSLIRHAHARMGIFAAKPIGRGIKVGYFDEALVFAVQSPRYHMNMSC